MKNISDTIVDKTEKLITIIFNTFFSKHFHLRDNAEKHCRVGRATVGNVAHVHFMVVTQGYKPSEYVIFISFPLQRWLQECASVLGNIHIACILT
jgi:hypothetical protein